MKERNKKTEDLDNVKITEVQLVVLKVCMNEFSITFPELVEKSLDRTDNLPESLSDTKWKDAVKMVCYINELRKNLMQDE